MTHKERAVQRRRMAVAVKAGADPKMVALQYDMSVETVRKAYFAFYGPLRLPRYTNGNGLSMVADMLNTDLTLLAIAEKHGVHHTAASAVYRACIKAGIRVPLRPRGRPTST